MWKNIKKLTYSQTFKEEITNAAIILDTDILIGLTVQNPAYIELFEILDTNNCSYFTIDLCIFEFLKGVETIKDILFREELLRKFSIEIIPSADLKEEFKQIIAIYRRSSATMDIADLFLSAALKKYQNNGTMYLLTGNYTDFLINYFDRKFIIATEEEKYIKPLVFLQLNKSTFSKGSKNFYQ